MSGNRQSTAGLQQAHDLAALPGLQDDVVVACLRERFMADTIYTRIGPAALVAVNPHKYVASDGDAVLHSYAQEFRDTQPGRTPLAPHVFQLANNAYYHMRRTAQDQCILMIGDTGSGKSENRRLAIKTLLELSVSSPGKKGSKLGTQVPAAEFILESFGSARTLFNPNASRFGKYTELQFNDRGRLAGVKTLDYCLERARVAGAPSGERNFHIFYYLVAGATPEERAHLRLADKGAYRYLGARGAGPAPGDAARFEQLKLALKNVGLSKRHVAQTCQLLAAILHLGNLDFVLDRARNEDAAVVRNGDVLDIAAEFLGVRPAALEAVLSYRTKMVKKELATVFLDADGAADNRDDLAKALYSLLFAWLNEHINQKLCRDDFSTLLALVDLPGPQNASSRPNSLDQFVVNLANERLHGFVQRQLFEAHVREYEAEGIAARVPRVPYFDNTECLRLLTTMPGGLVHIMDDQARRQPKKTDHSMVDAFAKRWGNHSSFKTGGPDRAGFPTFTVSHYHGPVTYSAEGFLDRNLASVNPDFVSLLRGVELGGDDAGSINPFVKGLFSTKAIATQAHPRDEETIVAAQQPAKPLRTPSTRRKGGTVRRSRMASTGLGDIDEKAAATEADDDEPRMDAGGGVPCVAGEFGAALGTLFDTLADAQAWFVFCVSPNDAQLPNQLEGRSVKGQVRALGLAEVAKRAATVFEVGMTPREFGDRYREPLAQLGVSEGEPREIVDQARTALGLEEKDIVQGREKVFLSHAAFHALEDYLRAQDTEEVKRNRMRDQEAAAGLDARDMSDPYAPYLTPHDAPNSPFAGGGGYGDPFNQSSQQLPLIGHNAPTHRANMYEDEYDDQKSTRSEDFDARTRLTSRDDASAVGSESYAPSRNMFQAGDRKALMEKEVLPGEINEGETAEVIKESSARRRWVALCWLLTFWVPNFALTHVGRMKRLDIRQAWREKLAINILIWLLCASTIFVIVALGPIICPTEHIFDSTEIKSHTVKNTPNQVYTSIRGEVFDLTQLAQTHQLVVPVVPQKSLLNYGGNDASDIFPVQVSALCNGRTGSVSPYVNLDPSNRTDDNAQYHDFRFFTNDPRPDWYFEVMTQMRWNYRVGFVGYPPKALKQMAAAGSTVAVYNGLVYDLSPYTKIGPGIQAPSGQSAPSVDKQFMDPSVVSLFQTNAGQDITKRLDSLGIDADTLARQKVCLRNLFTIGKVDNRQSPACQFSTYILLGLSVVMVSIIGFKFIASINLSSARAPENHDKFVICQIPCYTEGEQSIKRTVDSLAMTKYDDKRKLIVVICDGMVIGAGNDKSTPGIVLNVLGHDPAQEPEALSFISLGDGTKQHNMGKVYSGLYEVSGHVVPYLVLCKVGKPSERQKPGNRGKRDTQMLVMSFLNKVHFAAPMNPFELEVYHQIKNVIGVNPTFYEYILTVDADTTVAPLALNRLISAMVHDKKLLGVCGETQIANAKQSIITMMQVYEYFISHHMAKAFESLFGSVTCLPGCFTLFRLRTPDTYKPLLISNQIIHDYSENRVDTLHMKNLLHLGEDRYLTTLLLKHFPEFKTQFVRDAMAATVAPDEWSVLVSQRRRWINSTIHNLGELIFLDQLCGFCCFSMRFVVLIDLVSTIIAPVTVAYLGYLVYLVAGEHKTIPNTSLAMIIAVYGLQALVFILRRKWDMIGWMVFYIISIPATSFVLPLYSFWKMDDFSWGATRLVVGESGKKMVVHDEGKFDPKSIPLKTWEEYENELWDKESNHSVGSWVPPQKLNNEGYAQSATASIYGRETFYEPSQHNMNMGMAYPSPPEYQSGRNTPYGANGYNSSPLRAPMSEAGSLYQPAPTRPSTNYLDMPVPLTGSPDQLGGPSNMDLERAVNDLLRGADLNSVTKREIRRRLEEQFGMDLASRKATINAAIDRALLSHAG